MAKINEIRILDLDAGRLMLEESVVKAAVRKSKIKARVSMMADNLAITRQGLMDKVPVLEINGTIISHSKPLVLAEVMTLFKAL
ncbi:MAG: hypothetical protein JEZ12_21700 [Desulfobacterium sp.]|nr:hypothetical protein [Desulfobacterium sp.]